MNIRTSIIDSLCRTMPETAARSGFCSLVDHSALIQAAYDRLIEANYAWKMERYAQNLNCGLKKVREWLHEQGESAIANNETLSRKLQEMFLMEAIRRNSRKGDTGHIADVQ